MFHRVLCSNVRYITRGLQIVVIGDAADFLTGGYYRGTIHRVVQPPEDQQNYTRLGLFYFAMLNNDVKLVPMAQSLVLQRVGIQRRCDDNDAPTMGQLRCAKTAAHGQWGKKKDKEEGVIYGLTVKRHD
ncbi:hypothetical protein DFH29DRAFT_437817 [Suillus ampliporus]|nr:hypothetical protein DFH29DRAFT_437817 [Suillus ampliporus]